MKVTKGVTWALAGALTLGAVLGGAARCGRPPWPTPERSPSPTPFRRCRGEAVPEQLALARLGGLGLTEDGAEALWADLGEDRRRELIRSLGAPEWLDYLAFGFSWWERLDRYETYHAQHPELTAEEAVVRVNIGVDAPPYGDPAETEDPDSLTALVNQYHALPADYTPELVYLSAAYTNQRDRLRPVACRAFMKMADAAAQEGLRIYNASAYRSYATQKWVYQRYVNQEGTQEADTYSARPGCSEHQTRAGPGHQHRQPQRPLRGRRRSTPGWWRTAGATASSSASRRERRRSPAISSSPGTTAMWGPAAARVCYENGWTLEEYHARQPAPDR